MFRVAEKADPLDVGVVNQETRPLLRSIATAGLGSASMWQAWSSIAASPSAVVSVGVELADSVALSRFPDLLAVRHVPQDPEHHPEEDVWSHVWMAAFQASAMALRDDLSAMRRTVAVLAALTHDFGKPSTTEFHPSGKITSHGHDKAGVETARRFLVQIGAPAGIRERVLVLVGQHMRHVGTGGVMPTHRAVSRLLASLNTATTGATFDDWARLVDADTYGRGGARQKSPAACWREVEKLLMNHGAVREWNSVVTERLFTDNNIPIRGPAGHALIALARQAEAAGAFTDPDSAGAWLRRCSPTRVK